MENEGNMVSVVARSIIETNKLVKENNDALVANAHRQTDILESQINLYRSTLILVGINLLIGLGILITTFISYHDKKEIATLHAQLRDRDEQIRTMRTAKDAQSQTTNLPSSSTVNDKNK